MIDLRKEIWQVEDYRSEYDTNYIYSGWHEEATPVIIREHLTIKQTAQGVTDLDTDWGNKTSLTYI